MHAEQAVALHGPPALFPFPVPVWLTCCALARPVLTLRMQIRDSADTVLWAVGGPQGDAWLTAHVALGAVANFSFVAVRARTTYALVWTSARVAACIPISE